MLDGALAFKQGWRDFVSDHSISLGEFLIFKHISTFLFTVQIYGTSGLERLQFGKENSAVHKRKHSKNDVPDILSLRRSQECYEALERKHYASEKGSAKKLKIERKFPTESLDDEMHARSRVSRGAAEKIDSHEKSPPSDDAPGIMRSSSTVKYLGAAWKGKMVCDTGGTSVIVLSDCEDDSDEVSIIRDKSIPCAEKSKAPTEGSRKVHVKNKKEKLPLDERPINRCLFISDTKYPVVSKSADVQEAIETVPISAVYPEKSHSKMNPECIILEDTVGKMSQRVITLTIDHNRGRKGNPAACNRSEKRNLSASEKVSFLTNKGSVCKEELVQETPIDTLIPKTFKSSTQDTSRLEIDKENLSYWQESPNRPENVAKADHHQFDTGGNLEESCGIVTHCLMPDKLTIVNCSTEHGVSAKAVTKNNNENGSDRCGMMEFADKQDDGDAVGHERLESSFPNSALNEAGNQKTSKGFAPESLVVEEGMGHSADEGYEDKFEMDVDASIGLCTVKEEPINLDGDDIEPPQLSSPHGNNPEVLKCIGDDPGNAESDERISHHQSDGTLGNHADVIQDSTIKTSLVMAKISGSCKDLNARKEDSLLEGIARPEGPEVDTGKVTTCSEGEVLGVVKTEIMDSTDVLTIDYVEFRLTVSLISLSWLLLPGKLPARLLKKRCFRKVVMLQDTSMRVWPVLYHEGHGFIGFVGGWEEFAEANNLQLGDTCEFQSIRAMEPTFKVQILKI